MAPVLQCQGCDNLIADDDPVFWENYQQGTVYHRDCHEADDIEPREFEAGQFVQTDDLPDNEMLNSGKPDWVGDDLIVVYSDGVQIEMRMAYEISAVYELDEDADQMIGTVHSGTPRPLGDE